jgi:hypothetical protein
VRWTCILNTSNVNMALRHSGPLLKQNSQGLRKMKSWKTRYFLLENNMLYYYTTPRLEGEVRGSFNLTEYGVSKITKHGRSCIELRRTSSSDGASESTILEAPSEQELDVWLEKLSAAARVRAKAEDMRARALEGLFDAVKDPQAAPPPSESDAVRWRSVTMDTDRGLHPPPRAASCACRSSFDPSADTRGALEAPRGVALPAVEKLPPPPALPLPPVPYRKPQNRIYS